MTEQAVLEAPNDLGAAVARPIVLKQMEQEALALCRNQALLAQARLQRAQQQMQALQQELITAAQAVQTAEARITAKLEAFMEARELDHNLYEAVWEDDGYRIRSREQKPA